MSPVSVSDIGDYIREQREQAKISLRQLAQAAGVSSPYLSQVERGLRKPSADILHQIARGLRISAEALYAQAGALDEQHGDHAKPTVVDAIMADTEITERQKQMLLEVYESFRNQVRAEAGEEASPEPGAADDGPEAAADAGAEMGAEAGADTGAADDAHAAAG